MERHFDEELARLNEKLMRIAGRVERSISLSTDALKALDGDRIRTVISDDGKIDELELEIEDYAISLLSRYQPQASDLRFITNAMKINAELERIGDLSVDIAQRALEMVGRPLVKPLVDIPRMAEIGGRMVRDAITAFINRDVETARRVILADREMDGLRDAVHMELVHDYIMKNPADAPRAISLLLISRHLERISDHATNIAEDVIYMVKAEVVKHHPERLDAVT